MSIHDLIALFRYDVTSKQIYCLNAKNNGYYIMLISMKNRLKVYLL